MIKPIKYTSNLLGNVSVTDSYVTANLQDLDIDTQQVVDVTKAVDC